MPPPSEPRRTARVVLSGSAAAQWMADRGLRLLTAHDDLRLYADSMPVGDLTISRLYHNAERLLREGTGAGQRISVIADGEVVVSDASDRFPLVKGAAFMHAVGDPVLAQMSGPCATVEIELSPEFASRTGIDTPDRLQAAPADLGTTHILLAAVLATLNSGPTGTEGSWRRVHDVIENAAAALLSEVVPTAPADRSPAHDRLLRRARDLIDSRFGDEDFGVAELCLELSTSSTHLYRAFATTGATPLLEIHRTRLAAARTILQKRHVPTKEDRESIARLVGFRSWRALRAAERLVEKHDASARRPRPRERLRAR